MAYAETHPCPDCGTGFGSRRALTDHVQNCPVARNHALRRIQEQLEEQRLRIERGVQEGYRYAARAFAGYHGDQPEHGQRMHTWLAEDLASRVQELEALSASVRAASAVHFPRMNKLRSEVGLLVEQVQELTGMLETLHREYGVRP